MHSDAMSELVAVAIGKDRYSFCHISKSSGQELTTFICVPAQGRDGLGWNDALEGQCDL